VSFRFLGVDSATGKYSSLAIAAFSNGGTGQTTQQSAIDALTGTQSSGKYLRSDGTHATLTTIQAGDVPTLNQNTSGSAASFTGSLVGDVTGTQGSTVVGKINGVALSGLATGILKNTTSTGVPSIAAASDIPSQLTTKGDLLGFDTAVARIPVGTNNFVLTADSSQALGLKWAAVSVTPTVGSSLTLASSGTITITLTDTLQIYRAQGSSASVTLSTTPFGSSAPTNGTYVEVVGNDDTNTVIFTFSDTAKGCVGNFTSIELFKYQVVGFRYNSSFDRWVLCSKS
jgi:hypothetical protein